MISIVIPLYNKEQQIEATLASIFRQTFSDYEIVIVNDGSTDNGAKIVEEINDPRITLIHQENQGVAMARNHGIAIARYRYIALLDADDEWDADFLETQVELICNYSESKVFGCAYQLRNYKNENKNISLNGFTFSGDSGVVDNYFEVASRSYPPLCASAIVIEKEAFLSTGGFQSGITSGEDLLMWARLAVKYPVAYNKNPKAYFNQTRAQSYEDAPSRVPQTPDVVGEELHTLLRNNPGIKGLKQYVALWHKMRASTFLLLGKDSDAFNDSLKSLKYDFFNYKLWIYLALLLVPVIRRRKIFAKFGNQ